MKRILTLLALTLALSAWGQKLTEVGKMKELNYKAMVESQIVGPHNGEYYLACKKGNKLLLAAYDSQFRLLRKNTIDGLSEVAVADARVCDGKLCLLLDNRQNKERPAIYRVEANLNTLKLNGQPKSVSQTTTKRTDRDLWWVAQSTELEYTAIVHLNLDKEGNAGLASVTLLDSAFNQVWTLQQEVNSLSQVYVDNDGMVVCVGANDGNGLHLDVLAFLEGEKVIETSNGVSIKGLNGHRTGSTRLLAVHGDRLVFGGDIRTDKDRTLGCFGLAYDMVEDRIVGSSSHFMTGDECQAISLRYNEMTLKFNPLKQYHPKSPDQLWCDEGIDAFTLRRSVATPYGAAFLQYGMSRFCYGVAECYLHAYINYLHGVDTNGRLVWHHVIPYHNMVGDAADAMHLTCQGDNVILFQFEHKNDSPEYDPLATPNILGFGVMKSHMASFTVTPRGKISKRFIEEKILNNPGRRFVRPSAHSLDRLLFLQCYGTQQLYKLTF